MKIKNAICYADYILITYEDQASFDIFKKSGNFYSRENLNNNFNGAFAISDIDFITLPRLEWSDRYFDMVQ